MSQAKRAERKVKRSGVDLKAAEPEDSVAVPILQVDKGRSDPNAAEPEDNVAVPILQVDRGRGDPKAAESEDNVAYLSYKWTGDGVTLKIFLE